MGSKRNEGGEFTSEVTMEDVLGIFDSVEGPAITSTDVSDHLGCSREVARKRLSELHEEGRVERRKSGRTVLWWRTDRENDYERAIGSLEGSGIAEGMREERSRLREEWNESSLSG